MHGALLYLRDAGRYTDRHARPGKSEAEVVVHGADEVLKHLLRDGEVGDHAVSQRADGDDIGRCAADHALRLRTYRQDLLVDAVYRDDGRLIDDDSASPHHDQRICGSKVDGYVMRKKP